MRVLLTGASGFIGQYIHQNIISRNLDLYTISRNSNDNLMNCDNIDILKYDETIRYITALKPDLLVHLAWDVTHDEFWQSTKNYDYAEASINLFQAFIENGGKKIIAIGTCAEYPTSDQPVLENMVINQRDLTPYGQAKRHVHEWLEKSNVNFTWCRIFGIYGEGEDSRRLVPSMIKSIKNNKNFEIQNPNIFCDYVHVEDIASFIVECINKPGLGAINIGTGHGLAIYDLYQTIQYYLINQSLKIIKTVLKTSNKSRIPDCTKLKSNGFVFCLESGFEYFN